MLELYIILIVKYRIALFVPFNLAFLAAEDQYLSAVGEPLVGEHCEAEGGFAGFNEAGDQVDRNKSSDHR